MHSAASETEESIHQAIAASRAFVDGLPGAEVVERPGIVAVLGHVAIPMFNMVHPTSPVRDLDDLARRVEAAVATAGSIGLPWMLCLCDAWLPEGAASEAIGVLARHGLAPAMSVTGMVADALAPPVRPLPAIEMRRIVDDAIAAALSDLNCAPYGLPLDVGRASFGRPAAFAGDRRGYVGHVDGVPVSCAATLPLDGRLYVAYVATDAGHRRRGYAEAVMRRSIEEVAAATGLSRLGLHATDAGRPLYEQMGFRSVARFTYHAAGSASQ